MAHDRARWMNLIALAILVTALIAFVAFHFLVIQTYVDPGFGQAEERGWRIWLEVYEFLKDPDPGEIEAMVGVSSFMASVVLVVASPLLVPVFSRSRWAWWIAVLVSGSAMCGLGGVVLLGPSADPSYAVPGPGIHCLLAVLVLNFTGLLFIRRESRPSAEIDLQPPPGP
jgi:hypothetical protein